MVLVIVRRCNIEIVDFLWRSKKIKSLRHQGRKVKGLENIVVARKKILMNHQRVYIIVRQ